MTLVDYSTSTKLKNTTGKSSHVTLWSATAYQCPPYNATAYQCSPYNTLASMPHTVTKWMSIKYWAAIFITWPPILMFKCQPWSKMRALAASLIILVTSCTYLEIWFDSGLHVPNDPCLTDSPWLLSCSSFSKRQKSSNSWVSHESRLSTPVMGLQASTSGV